MGPMNRIPAPQLHTCVTPRGRFAWGIHRPHYEVANLRIADHLQALGQTLDGEPVLNTDNFPPHDVQETDADTVFEIPNPLPFRGVTYITRAWAEKTAHDPARIAIAGRKALSLHQHFSDLNESDSPLTSVQNLIARLPETLQLALATTSSDSEDLCCLADLSCAFVKDNATGRPCGLQFTTDAGGRPQAVIHNHLLFESVANNPHLPDDYKVAMVLRPGVQGGSEIVGEWRSGSSHVFEYLRRNSYIPWGHFAANMADDAVSYDAGKLTPEDVQGMRHLYYQRTYVRLADMLELPAVPRRRMLSTAALEKLRAAVLERISPKGRHSALPFSATLWGWNYGFDYAPSGYRLHASHQQIHQQHALIPAALTFTEEGREYQGSAYACGDRVQEFGREFRRQTGRGFFECYLQALRANRRLDGRTEFPADLVIHEDDHTMLFVPKAQTSQWELQLVTTGPVGNILEADTAVRNSLDRGLLTAMQILTAMGATMISLIEMGKRFDCDDADQRLLYSLLPRLPESPGAFSEAQLRWICGHFPEDFARACRARLPEAVGKNTHP
jgi:hypothetical protein